MQDVAIDALAVNTLREDERGLANGVMFAGASIGTGDRRQRRAVPDATASASRAASSSSPPASCAVTVLHRAAAAGAGHAAGATGARPALASAAARDAALRGASRSARFLGTRGAFAGLFFALLPAGAMSAGAGAAVEPGGRGRHERRPGRPGWRCGPRSSRAGCMVLGGRLSDRFGRRRTLFVYLALMSLPVLYLMGVLHRARLDHAGGRSGADRRVPPAGAGHRVLDRHACRTRCSRA